MGAQTGGTPQSRALGRELDLGWQERWGDGSNLGYATCCDVHAVTDVPHPSLPPSPPPPPRGPVLDTPAQVAGWRKVVDAVHGRGGRLYAQLFHAGRVSHSSLVGGAPPLAPSAVAMRGQLYVEGGVKADYETPRAASEEEVAQVVRDFAAAARRAVQVGGDV